MAKFGPFRPERERTSWMRSEEGPSGLLLFLAAVIVCLVVAALIGMTLAL